jgi:hypothetical protein
VVKQGVYERAAIALVFGGPGPGVDHHAGGLVDDSEVGVFVEDVEWDIFGDGSQWRARCRRHDGDAFATAKFQGGPGRFIVHEHFLLGDELLDARAAYIQTECQELIEALAGVFGCDCDLGGENLGHFPRTMVSVIGESVAPDAFVRGCAQRNDGGW